MKPPAPTVFVVDDDQSVREALASLLGSASIRVEAFASAREFLRHPRSEGPSCLVLDVSMPDLSGLDLQRELAAAALGIPIIFITAHADVPTAVQAMKAGAIEFLSKPFSEHALFDAIRHGLERDRTDQARRAELAALRGRRERLTPREREVMARIAGGRRNKQIAAELGLSENTVKVHRHHIMEKMGVATFAELMRLIDRLGPMA
jgi:FixJ family two-component response regulator